MSAPPLDVEAAAAEVVQHHVCIERSLSGAEPVSDAVFAALADPHLPEFALVGPTVCPGNGRACSPCSAPRTVRYRA